MTDSGHSPLWKAKGKTEKRPWARQIWGGNSSDPIFFLGAWEPEILVIIYSLFSTRLCRIILAFTGSNVSISSSSSTFLASWLSVNTRCEAWLSDRPPSSASRGRLSSFTASAMVPIVDDEQSGTYRSTIANTACRSRRNWAAPRAVNLFLRRMSPQRLSCRLSRALRTTRLKVAVLRVRARKSKLRLMTRRGSSSSAVMASR